MQNQKALLKFGKALKKDVCFSSLSQKTRPVITHGLCFFTAWTEKGSKSPFSEIRNKQHFLLEFKAEKHSS